MNLNDRPVDIETLKFPPSEAIPNHPTLPLLIYRGALESGDDLASQIEQRYQQHGWVGTWRNGVYPFHHYHSNAHEVLAVAAGAAEIQFGGPDGKTLSVEAGDVAILPAGTGHKRIDASNDLLVVGAYPAGQSDYDLLPADPKQLETATQRITRVPLPETDPVFGAPGPLLEHWR